MRRRARILLPLLMVISPLLASAQEEPEDQKQPVPVLAPPSTPTLNALGVGAARLKKCVSALVEANYHPDTAREFCKYEERVIRVEQSDLADCLQKLDSVGAKEKFGPLCFYYRSTEMTDSVLQCIKTGIPSHQSWFWHYEDNEALRALQRPAAVSKFLTWNKTAQGLLMGKFNTPFFMKRLMKDCRAPVPAEKVGAINARVATEVIYHTDFVAPGRKLLLGGLSGLTVRGDNELLSITDDKANPSIYHFEFAVKDSLVSLKYKGFTDLPFLKESGADLEDISLRKDGSIYISSEVSKSETQQQIQPFGFFGHTADPNQPHNPLDDEPDTFIFKLDPKAQGAHAVLLPEYIFPASQRVEMPCPPPGSKKNSEHSFVLWALGGEDEEDQVLPEKPHPEKKCYSTYWHGVKWNKGLEAMTVDRETDHLLFAPEQPMAGATDLKTVPLFKMDLTKPASREPEATYSYPLDLEFDNGIVAITRWDHDTYLTLERGFNAVRQEAVVKLYKIHLNGKPEEKLKKELIVNFDQLAPTFAAGFRTVENFEGLAAGPTLPSGERVLFVVSDNNFNLSQKTVLLALALKPGI